MSYGAWRRSSSPTPARSDQLAVIDVHVTRLRDDAVLPQGAYPGDAGLDLVACETVELGPGERALVPTGIAVAIPEGHAGFVVPRSGLALRHGISLVNTPGIIDSGYRGELRVIAVNTDRDAVRGRGRNADRPARRSSPYPTSPSSSR